MSDQDSSNNAIKPKKEKLPTIRIRSPSPQIKLTQLNQKQEQQSANKSGDVDSNSTSHQQKAEEKQRQDESSSKEANSKSSTAKKAKVAPKISIRLPPKSTSASTSTSPTAKMEIASGGNNDDNTSSASANASSKTTTTTSSSSSSIPPESELSTPAATNTNANTSSTNIETTTTPKRTPIIIIQKSNISPTSLNTSTSSTNITTSKNSVADSGGDNIGSATIITSSTTISTTNDVKDNTNNSKEDPLMTTSPPVSSSSSSSGAPKPTTASPVPTRQSTRQQEQNLQKQQQQQQKPTTTTPSRKIPHYDKTQPINYNHPLSTVNQIQIHHQSSTLHYCYNPRNGKWYNQGTTTIYLTLDTSSSSTEAGAGSSASEINNVDSNNNSSSTPKKSNMKNDTTNATTSAHATSNEKSIQTREIALHLRHGQSITITNSKVYTPLPTTDTSNATHNNNNTSNHTTRSKTTNSTTSSNNTCIKLLPLPRGYVSYFDPLHKIYTKKSTTFSAMEYISHNVGLKRNKRYEADGYSSITGGGCSLMEEIRCCSIASNFGEMRIQVTCPMSNDGRGLGGYEVIKNVWKHDLLDCTSGVRIKRNDSGKDAVAARDDDDFANTLKTEEEQLLEEKLLHDEYLASNGGELELNLKQKCLERGIDRRDERIDLIASRLAHCEPIPSTDSAMASSANNNSDANVKQKGNNAKGQALGIKLVIDFEIDPIDPGSHHYGGIHFHSPPKSHYSNGIITTTNQTPHVYTTSGITGDNFGPRCFIPTVDSSSVKHRFSHELTVKVTSDMEQGLWAAGCGEHFGVNGAVLHAIPREPKPKKKSYPKNGNEEAIPSNHNFISGENEELMDREEKNMKTILGKDSVDFVAKSFAISPMNSSPSSPSSPVRSAVEGDTNVHVIPIDESAQSSALNYQLATSIWTTSIWSPCPVRSIGFAIGPFKVVYDPEYYGKQDDDDDDDDDDAGAGNTDQKDDMDDEDGNDYPTISESAVIKGEGIRQLYFAPQDERAFIHHCSAIITSEGLQAPQSIEDDIFVHQDSTKSSALLRMQKKQFLISIMGATAGVPNRALSLMRDILALPSYRTMSYTQIWIPNAVDGGSSCGALHSCPEVSCNPFLGGAILDATILPPLGQRLPFHPRGRSLQLLQARCAVKGWIRAALPLGGNDEIGHSYIHAIFEEFIMNLYERAHGAFGEGGSKQSFFYTKRFAINSGLNSRNMDFLPIHNVEEEDFAFAIGGVVGALPAEDHSSDRLFRNANNGTESHTAALDESLIRNLLSKDTLEGLERGDKSVPLPSGGWLGSTYSATFLSSNSASSSSLGVGSVELVHPTGGQVYRSLKSRSLRRIIQGRIGLSNFVRVIRAAFIAAILHDKGATNVDLPAEKQSNKRGSQRQRSDSTTHISHGNKAEDTKPKPIFVLCVDELIKKGGMTHGSFTRTIQNISGPIRHPYLGGTIVDVSRDAYETSFLQPEGFPNSFVRGSSSLYLRVGTYVDSGNTGDKQSAQGSNKLQVVVEPVIPNGGIAYGGPVTIRVVENGGQGQCNEYVKSIASDGSRTDWGPIFLHGDPVTSTKQQNAANGLVESTSRKKTAQSEKFNKKRESAESNVSLLDSAANDDSAFNATELHNGGYQALELVRFTNLSPLLWVRVDPQGCFDGRISLFQQDSCLGEQLFHDGEASSQIEALRALAERPLPLQGTAKIKNVYGVPITELPVRLLADCLRGSVALHADLPHNPAVRAQAALAIAQWQNNKAPNTKDSFEWTGLKLLIQYVTERFHLHGSATPNKYFKVCLKTASKQTQSTNSGGAQSDDPGLYQYLDDFDDESIRERVVESAIQVEKEEDEEHRVRSAAITAIACCRAKDGQTPPLVLRVLEEILLSGDDKVVINQMTIEENMLVERKKTKKTADGIEISKEEDAIVYTERNLHKEIADLPYSSASLIGDTLLSLCYVNASPKLIEDPTTGKASQSRAHHPVIPLMQACYKWLQWDLYKEDVWLEDEMKNKTGVGRNSVIASCAITSLCILALLRQITTDSDADVTNTTDTSKKRKKSDIIHKMIDDATSVQYYIDIFDGKPFRADSTRIAAAQAVACLCCAVDRNDNVEDATGLLKALNFLLSQILEPTSAPKLRQTLALLMLDACSGKIVLNQRAATIANYNDMIIGGARLYNGPLGASYGNDVGNTIFMSVSEGSLPAANAVNNGAKKGLRVLRTAGKPNQKKPSSEHTIVQVALFATKLWRTINGELGGKINEKDRTSLSVTCVIDGVCAYDSYLRSTLLALWQCIWPNSKNSNGLCPAVQRVQSWKQHADSQKYRDLGADKVMSVEDDEQMSAEIGYKANEPFRKIIISEIDRQRWRGEMAKKKKAASNSSKDPTAASLGLNQPLDIVDKDDAWRLGSWVTSAAHQRRSIGADGGSMLSVTKLRLTMKGGD